MTLYLIGDIQGCDSPLQQLLDTLGFSPSRDTLFALGDLVNRGPQSLAVLRRLQGLGASARCVLGNHDLHLLAVAAGVRDPHRSDTLAEVLSAPDRPALLDWLRQQPMAMHETLEGHPVLMVHAGVMPSWTAQQTMALAAEVQTVLRGPQCLDFLGRMYGNKPTRWSDDLAGMQRLRGIVNALTRLRFCTADGAMDLESKEGADGAPAGFLPWYEVPGRRTAATTVAFGHWSTLGWLGRHDVLSMDTGCVWGGCLSAVRVLAAPGAAHPGRELVQVRCPQAQKPGP
jgi:bis(5'-nucleosyl)-tetraphosphatase (symmetrical)